MMIDSTHGELRQEIASLEEDYNLLMEENVNLRRANLHCVDEFNQIKEDYDRLLELNRLAAPAVQSVLTELMLRADASGYYQYENGIGTMTHECTGCGASTTNIAEPFKHRDGCPQAKYENHKMVTFDQLERVVAHLLGE